MLVVVLSDTATAVDVRIVVTLDVIVTIWVISAGKANSVTIYELVNTFVIVLVGTGSVVAEVTDVTRFRAVFTTSVDVQATTSPRSMACGARFFF